MLERRRAVPAGASPVIGRALEGVKRARRVGPRSSDRRALSTRGAPGAGPVTAGQSSVSISAVAASATAVVVATSANATRPVCRRRPWWSRRQTLPAASRKVSATWKSAADGSWTRGPRRSASSRSASRRASRLSTCHDAHAAIPAKISAPTVATAAIQVGTSPYSALSTPRVDRFLRRTRPQAPEFASRL
jgi:hypothetical protein